MKIAKIPNVDQRLFDQVDEIHRMFYVFGPFSVQDVIENIPEVATAVEDMGTRAAKREVRRLFSFMEKVLIYGWDDRPYRCRRASLGNETGWKFELVDEDLYDMDIS